MLSQAAVGVTQRGKRVRLLRDSEGKKGRSHRGFLKRAASAVRYVHTHTPLQGWGLTVLRVVTGTVFLMSGGHKLFGGGLGTVSEGLGELQVPSTLLLATTVTLVEFLGGAALVLGLFTRWVSMPLAAVMVADILLIHPPRGLFVEDTGYEYALLRLSACVTLVLAGSGKAALGGLLASWLRPSLLRLLRW